MAIIARKWDDNTEKSFSMYVPPSDSLTVGFTGIVQHTSLVNKSENLAKSYKDY